MLLYLTLDPYLAQWFVNDCGGDIPVRLRRGSPESDILQVFLSVPPENFDPTPPPGAIPVILPAFAAKDTRSAFYLSPAAERLLVDLIRTRFDCCMWKELFKFSSLFSRIDNLIYAFMERHGIEPDERNFNAIVKRFQRKRDIYRKSVSRKGKKAEK